MALKTMLKKIRDAQDKYQKALKDVGKDFKKQLGEQVKEAMALLPPEYTYIVWTQFTPYFNDGEPCEFEVGDANLMGGGPTRGDGDFTTADGWPEDPYADATIPYLPLKIDSYVKSEYAAQIKRAGEGYKQLRDLWASLSQDTLEKMFGDHVKIVIRRDGRVLVGEYEHD